MSIPFMLVVWLFAIALGFLNGTWRSLKKREAWVAGMLLALSLALTIGMAINPQLPNLTEWVEHALTPLRPLLEPVS